MAFGLSEIALALFKRAGSSATTKDKGSLFMLWIAIAASIYGAIRISHWLPQFDFDYSSTVYWLAASLFLGGAILRWWSIFHLGRFFTVDVAIAADHRVVRDGPYTFVRHPSYTGVLLIAFGLGLLLFNWAATIVLVAPIVAVFLWRISVEERALLRALGAEYLEYMGNTKRLVPFVY